MAKIPIFTSLILFPFHCHLYIGLPVPSNSFSGSAVPQRRPHDLVTFLHESTSSDSNSGGRTDSDFSEVRSIGMKELNETADNLQQLPQQSTRRRISMITSIRCRNLAGIVDTKRPTSDGKSEIVLNLDSVDTEKSSCNLVAVTGETGSGKSLLVSKIVDLATGGKATASLLRSTDSTSFDGADSRDGPPPGIAEIVLALYDPSHVSLLRKILLKLNMDAESIFQAGISIEENGKSNTGNSIDETVGSTTPTYYIRLKRTLSLNGARVKSSCSINDYPLTLKAMKTIGTPLVAIVDAAAAGAALGRKESRLQMVDAGVPSHLILWVRQLQTAYRRARMRTHSLERELARRTLPRSLGRDLDDDGNTANDKTLDLMRHWDEELDGFQRRISNLQRSLRSSESSMVPTVGINDRSEMALLLDEMESLEWMANDNTESDEFTSFSSTLYRRLLDLSDLLKSLDGRIAAASEARERLASLSVSYSAQTALEQARRLLLDATNRGRDGPPPRPTNKSRSTTPNSSTDDAILAASEKAHQLLNRVEDALLECAIFLDDDDHGLSATLRSVRRECSISGEALYEYITEWNTLARKHGVPPYRLPSAHATLKEELGGGVEARKLLPQAREEEANARKELMAACTVLTDARAGVCRRLSQSVSARLPQLGMEQSRFEARITTNNFKVLGSKLGNDDVDFYLLHTEEDGEDNDDEGRSHYSGFSSLLSPYKERSSGGGRLENVASSGEKARILLAMECEIPGSIQALCCGTTMSLLDEKKSNNNSNNNDDGDNVDDFYYPDWSTPPVAVIYDEIDAHVGGRASISVGQMLSDQSRSCQVFSITHSASLAAIANTHIRIQRGPSSVSPTTSMMSTTSSSSSHQSSGSGTGGRRRPVSLMTVDVVTGDERRREVARMASGDMAVEEAEVFAEALLRDASSSSSS